ncbi:hypothetical protein E5676_scaffold73G00340 [Cucumis melo var. makuwa]|uniref:Uncharacterized protein n=1 Tax=Cucumis melo var. makuwa TaxID=1194695 RepID=A0A5D3CGX2_CUCMM|nr:hypothetical protein E5676_scaffold73G00340 [Cucumis melo var. makuwa]
MIEKKASEQSEKKEASNTADQFAMDIKIVRSDGPVSEQRQLGCTSHNKALPSSSSVFGTEGWNPFNFKGKVIPMIDDNIAMMLKLLL